MRTRRLIERANLLESLQVLNRCSGRPSVSVALGASAAQAGLKKEQRKKSNVTLCHRREEEFEFQLRSPGLLNLNLRVELMAERASERTNNVLWIITFHESSLGAV